MSRSTWSWHVRASTLESNVCLGSVSLPPQSPSKPQIRTSTRNWIELRARTKRGAGPRHQKAGKIGCSRSTAQKSARPRHQREIEERKTWRRSRRRNCRPTFAGLSRTHNDEHKTAKVLVRLWPQTEAVGANSISNEQATVHLIDQRLPGSRAGMQNSVGASFLERACARQSRTGP